MKGKLSSGRIDRTGGGLLAIGLLLGLLVALVLSVRNAQAATSEPSSSPSPTPAASPSVQPGHWDVNGAVITLGGNLAGRVDASGNTITFKTAATPGKWAVEMAASGNGPASLTLRLTGPGPVMLLRVSLGGLPLNFGYAPSSGFSVSLGNSLPSSELLAGARPVAAVVPTLAANDGTPGAVANQIRDWVRNTIAFTLVGWLLLVAIPQLRRTVVVRGRTYPLASIALGLILVVDIPLLALALIAVGLPTGIWWLGILALLLYLVLAAVGLSFTAIEVGRVIFELLGFGRFNAFITTPAGVALICLLGLIPYVGGLVMVASVIYGIGALFLWPRRMTAIAPAPTPSPTPVAASSAMAPSGRAME